MVKEMKKKKR